jgi:hypothetical protein
MNLSLSTALSLCVVKKKGEREKWEEEMQHASDRGEGRKKLNEMEKEKGRARGGGEKIRCVCG